MTNENITLIGAMEVKIAQLREQLDDMKQDRDSLVVKNHELSRKFEHEVGRLNTIISKYRQEIIALGQKK